MALQFILGGSGSGKSYYAMSSFIAEAIAHPKEQYLILVPEQFTMQTQKDIVRMHPNHGVLNIDILSFERLAYRVFEELGTDILEILDDTGKNLILRKVLEQVKPQLTVFARKAGYQGFLEEIKSVLSEFGQYRIGEKALADMEQKTTEKPLLSAKIKDIHTIYNSFQAMIQERYVTSEALLEVLSRKIGESQIVRGSSVLLDGYTGFTPVQYQFLEQLLLCSRNVVVTAIMSKYAYEKQPEEGELFGLSRSMLEKLTALAQQNRIAVKEPFWIPEPSYRFRDSEGLAYLERYLFMDGTHPVYQGKNQVSVHCAVSPSEEVVYTAAQIYHLVREKGYRYRDIAVITADMEGYYRLVRDIFAEQGIPAFIDHKRDILGNPCVELIQSALLLLEQDFSYEAVFRYLKTGFTGLAEAEVDLLENYVLAMNIRGLSRWKKEWEKPSKTIPAAYLEPINRTRAKMMEQLVPFRTAMKKKGATVKQMMTALYQLLENLQAREQLLHYAEYFQAEGQMDRSREYLQIWKTIMELFEKIVRLFGDMRISIRELSDILESGFHEIKVAVIPPGLDEVTVGDTIRTRLTNIKVLFFLGVNDGIVPPAAASGGVLSNMDRVYLRQQSFELAPTTREQTAIDRFYLYLALTKPSQLLYLTYSQADGSGKPLRPSSLITQVEQTFGQQLERREHKDILQKMTSNRQMLRYTAGKIDSYGKEEMSAVWKEVFSFLLKQEALQPKVRLMIEGSCYEAKQDRLERAVAGQLYPDKGIRSITRLETFAACAYCHFMQYGLALVPREIHKIEAADIGTLFHNALERVSEQIEKGVYSWRTLSDEERNLLVTAAVEETITEFGNEALDSSARNSYMKNRLLRVTDRTVWALCQQVKQGEFEPAYYEFRTEKGRVDRIDLYESDDAVYVKIIDYKSGMKQFHLLDSYYGLQMQLVWYLKDTIDALKKQFPNKEIRPGAIFYYHIQDPYVEREETDYLKTFAMSGLVNSRVEVLESLDRELPEKLASSVIPVKYTKSHTIDSRSKVATEAQFADLEAYITQKAVKMNEEIQDGCIEKNPYQRGSLTPCNYCAYKEACSFDTRFPGFSYRQLKPMKPEELWERMQEGGEGNAVDQKPAKGN